MTRKKFRPLLLTLLVITAFASCSKDVAFESETDDGGKLTKGTLIVRTRANADAGTGTVSYPVNVYVFDMKGTCVDVATIESAETPLSLTLKEGMYSIDAVAGATADNYDLPTKENATRETLVTLKSGKQHGDLMTAHNTIVLGDGETNTLTLGLKRKVMLLQDVTINDVPSSVTSVSVTVAPLYENICVNGTLSGTNGSKTVDLTKQDGTKVWKSSGGVYMLEPSGNATVSVKMTNSEGVTKSYSYTCSDKLEANYKLTIEGTYTGKMEVEMTGTITGEEWAGERNINFNFNESGSSEVTGGEVVTPEDNTGNQTIEGEAVPAVYSVYKGTVVLSAEPQGDNTTVVTLISPLQAFNLSFDENDQTSVKAAIDTAVNTLAVDGITGWRVPTGDEIISMTLNYEKINKAFKDISKSETIIPDMNFFYKSSNGEISSYCKDGSVKLSVSRLRAVATVIFK